MPPPRCHPPRGPPLTRPTPPRPHPRPCVPGPPTPPRRARQAPRGRRTPLPPHTPDTPPPAQPPAPPAQHLRSPPPARPPPPPRAPRPPPTNSDRLLAVVGCTAHARYPSPLRRGSASTEQPLGREADRASRSPGRHGARAPRLRNAGGPTLFVRAGANTRRRGSAKSAPSDSAPTSRRRLVRKYHAPPIAPALLTPPSTIRGWTGPLLRGRSRASRSPAVATPPSCPTRPTCRARSTARARRSSASPSATRCWPRSTT
jgi:hypothetical protein